MSLYIKGREIEGFIKKRGIEEVSRVAIIFTQRVVGKGVYVFCEGMYSVHERNYRICT